MPSLNSQIKLTHYISFHPFIAWLIFLALTALALNELNQIRAIWRLNDLIENPQKIDYADTDLPPEVLFSRAHYLNGQGDYQEALRLYLQIERQGNENFRLNIQYNMGVIYLQQASKLWKSKGVWEYSQINTLLDLAEQYLRQVLIKKPDHWQARFNLEYALRIRPPAKEQEKSDWQGHKSSVHAIMPGIPEGGP